MAIVLSYVDKNGHVLECFISIEHVISTAAFSLKETIDEVFSRHKLSMSRLCGQGYDGASNMQANNLLDSMQSFDFVLNLHLMKDILRITNELPQALQMKDQDIVNAMKLVGVCKQRLEMMRKSGWGSLLGEVSEFHLKHDIDVPNMDDMFLSQRRGQRKAQAVTNMHHYCDEIFYVVLDSLLQELNNRFNETNTELLLCLACLCPAGSFSAFDSQKLLRLAQFYPKDFSMNELVILNIQLETYIVNMRSSIEFLGLKEIGDLAN
ncbi:uncharacterized protein LOC125470889 [Pyrus x bretschneideri]|uniref:uncharacterized protein LOC125470889 n=1 Tax=Pyrus x bretschneideri TaxID=225117 RepID=UPI0020306126|nr:uncharacterized protein LOC125470889 [Pyrus x bretschneideri]